MEPLAFEELLLECFERRAIQVVRNRRYTGDGGIDGKVKICGWVWLVQAKRYADTIRPEHVEAFAQLRSEEHTSELQSLMRISYDVFCLKKKIQNNNISTNTYRYK